MAVEDYFPIGSVPGDEEDNAADCRFCGKPIFLEVLPGRRFRLYDYYTGERHVCEIPLDRFPPDEAQ